MKGRKNQKTYKLRTQILHKHLDYLLDKNKLMLLLNFYSKKNKVINDFIYGHLKKIEPKILVDYHRRPINKFGLLFRLTFDTISNHQKDQVFDTKNKYNFKDCVAGKTILEQNLKEVYNLGFIG